MEYGPTTVSLCFVERQRITSKPVVTSADRSVELQHRRSYRVNKDGRLITADYVLPKAPNIIAVIKRLGFYSFPSVSDVPHFPKRMCCVRRCTRLRLVSHSRELKFVMTW